MKKQSKNYLDFIPRHNPSYAWTCDAQGRVEIRIQHGSFFSHLAQRYFHRPSETRLTLEGMGSFIWQQINGKRSIYEIGELLSRQYEDEAEPLYARLCLYMKNLEKLRLVAYVEKS